MPFRRLVSPARTCGLVAALLSVFFVVDRGRTAAQAPADKVFFGNLHSHTSYSDGSGTPDDAYRHAKLTAHLDFLAITEHNHDQAESGAGDRQDGILIATNPSLYTGPAQASLIPTAARWTTAGEFVALYGQEFSSISQGNHMNVFDVPLVIDVANGRFDLLFENWIPAHLDSAGQRAIVQFNHPAQSSSPSAKEYGRDDFDSDATWVDEVGALASLIEVLNGPALTKDIGHRAAERMEKDFLEYLRLGFHLAPTGDQDNHYFTWGDITDVRTGIITDELTKPKLLQALRARHVYATEDKNLRLVFRVNGELAGSRLAPIAINSELNIQFSIVDDDEPNASYEIKVLSGIVGQAVAAQENEVVRVEGDTPGGTIQDIRYAGGPQYFLFRVRQFSEHGPDDFAWTAPVWFDGTGSPASPPPTPVASTFVASKNSEVYHVSLTCKDAQNIKAANRVFGAQAREGRREHEACPRH